MNAQTLGSHIDLVFAWGIPLYVIIYTWKFFKLKEGAPEEEATKFNKTKKAMYLVSFLLIIIAVARTLTS